MNKKLLFSISSLVLSTFVTYSQNAIPNPGFETWLSGEPIGGWGTINGLQPGSCTQATGVDAHSGNSAVKLTSILNKGLGGILPGAVATGTFNINIFAFDEGVAFNLHPDSLTGWYKSAPVNNDLGQIIGILTRWNGTERDTIATADFEVNGVQSSYLRFKKEFNYLLAGDPDTMQVICISGEAEINNQLWIDDLGLVYNPSVGINDAPSGERIEVYPNPVSENLFVDMSGINDSKILIFDITGKRIAQYNLEEKINRINISSFAKGLYLYQVITENKATLNTGKFVVK